MVIARYKIFYRKRRGDMSFFKKITINKLIQGLLVCAVLGGGYVGYKSIKQYIAEHATLDRAPEEIKGSIITLKLLKEDYFLDYHTMYSPIVRKALEAHETSSLGYSIELLHWEMKKIKEGKVLFYCIFDNKDNKLIGSLEIRDKNSYDPGQFGCWTNEKYWGGGRIQEAIKLITKMYFRLKSHENSFIAHVRVWNDRSYHALKKAGFKEIGFFYENDKPTRYILEMTRS